MTQITEKQESRETTPAQHLEHLAESCRADFHVAGSHDFRDASVKPDTAGPYLPSCSIDGASVGAGAIERGVGASAQRDQDNAAVLQAKENTKGWDSKEPPSLGELNAKIGDKPIILWGDNHDDRNSPERFKEALGTMKRAGVDTVVMEGFREGQQGLINSWLSTQKGSAEEKASEAQIEKYLNIAVNQGDDFNNKTMNLLHSIKDARMNILCPEPDGGRMTGEGDGEKKDRDGNWAPVTNNYLLNEHPGAKVIVFAGSRHFSHHPEGKRFADEENGKAVDLTPPSQYIVE